MTDEPDDSMAANPEPPQNRRRREIDGEGHWVPVWVETSRGGQSVASCAKRVCRGCQQPAAILHSIHPNIERQYCGDCQGRANQERR